MVPQATLVLTSQVQEDGKIVAALTEMPLPAPAEHEVVIAVEAAPINPSDLGLLFSSARIEDAVFAPGRVEAPLSPAGLAALSGRLGDVLPVGNEGAGTVIAAGSGAAAQALLGCVMFDNQAFEGVGDRLRPEHFYEPLHARLFAEIEARIHKGQLADAITMVERFGRDSSFEEMGGVRYLVELVDKAPPSHRVGDYAREIYEEALRRSLIAVGQEIAGAAADPEPTSWAENV